ncbi:O-antigen ligase family protein [Liquorilactobacillus mali]|uniref:O-antigen ligase family protein n=1 Tax=Liquorilactobacillus mali TaxID=1618 RepID=UPI0009EA4389|nr:O-antigen ligase family protein [Liquorilactobacillus mali]
MSLKIRISKIQVISAIVFLCSIDIGYIDDLVHVLPKIVFLIRLFLIMIFFMGLCVKSYKKNFQFSTYFLLLTIVFFFISIVTIENGGSFFEFSKQFSMIYLIAIFIETYRKDDAIFSILEIWKSLLFILILLDWVSMLLFPSGLYTTIYTDNWFLGYKTERFVFYLPFAIISGFLSLKKHNRIGINTYFTMILCMLALLYCKGTSIFFGMLIVFLLFILLDIGIFNKKINFILNKSLSVPFVLSIYTVVNISLLNAISSKFLDYLLVNVFHKDLTLDTRTLIWQSCFQLIKTNKFFGKGFLTYQNYQYYTSNLYATSAHNMLLTLLVTGGFFLLLCYAVIIFLTVSRHVYMNNKYSNFSKVLAIGVVSMLVVGVTSSEFVFSEFGFIFFSLGTIDLKILYEMGDE